jgi:diguanylate cyclase (GGDEF)-like protein
MDIAAPRDPAPDDGARLHSLIVLANALAAATRVEALVEVVAEEALRAMGAASLSVSRWERERGVLRTLINVGELGPGEERNPEDEVYRLAEFPVANDLLLRGQPYVLREDEPGDPAGKAIAERLEKGSQVGVPIMASERMWGELWATTRRGEPSFTDTDVEVLTAIARQVGVAVERGELLARVTEEAVRDPLTGTANRRELETRAAEAIATARRNGTGLALLLVDLDGLKAINDARGHDAGDRAILGLSRALEAAVDDMPGAVVGRLGGDEFCALLPAADAQAATTAARLVRERLEATPGVAFSSGTARLETTTRGLIDLLAAADRELYRAKRGPNRRRPRRGDRGRRRRRDAR